MLPALRDLLAPCERVGDAPGLGQDVLQPPLPRAGGGRGPGDGGEADHEAPHQVVVPPVMHHHGNHHHLVTPSPLLTPDHLLQVVPQPPLLSRTHLWLLFKELAWLRVEDMWTG